jgi:hypothetical protein
MQHSRSRLTLRSALIKGSSITVFGIFSLAVILGILGFPQIAYSLLINSFPWFFKLLVLVGCFLSVSALRESI